MTKVYLETITKEFETAYQKIADGETEGFVDKDGSINDFFPYICKISSSWVGVNWTRTSTDIIKDFRKAMVGLGALCIEAIQWCDQKLAGDP